MTLWMNRLKALVFVFFTFFGFISSPVNAQINLKTGYNISFLSSPGLDGVIEVLNSVNTYSSPFPNLKWMHGIEAGLRFKSDIHALELTYQVGYQPLKAKGDPNDGSQSYTDVIRFNLHSAGIGYQATGPKYGFGTDIQYQWYRTHVEFERADEIFRDVQNLMSLKIYPMITLQGSKGIDVVLQPYVVFPFKAYDLAPLSQYLEQEPSQIKDKWTRFGLTMLFYNGPK